MRIVKGLMKKIRLSIFIAGAFCSPSLGSDRFPLQDPEITGTFMEYRSTHFHGGVDMIPRGTNNIVRAVADGELSYQIDKHSYEMNGVSKVDTTYRIWIDHNSGNLNGMATRYLHLGNYPGKRDHMPGAPRTVVAGDILGTIVTPHDDVPNHVHFEIRDGSILRSADYINPLSKLPAIADDSVDYSTSDDSDPWTWTIVAHPDLGSPNGEDFVSHVDYDVSDLRSFQASGLPRGEVRLLFEGYDRINNSGDRHLGFYSVTARFWKSTTSGLGEPTLRREQERSERGHRRGDVAAADGHLRRFDVFGE